MAVERVDPRWAAARTTTVVASAARRRDVAGVLVLTGLAYLLVYLYAIGNLTYQPGIGTDLFVVDDPPDALSSPAPAGSPTNRSRSSTSGSPGTCSRRSTPGSVSASRPS